VLYNDFFPGNEMQDDLDLPQVLKERERDPAKKKLLDIKYTDVLLVFDLDPQDPLFSNDKIRRMQEYFCESSDMGKLYINYPMVEAFYHMRTIPDPDYQNRIVSMEELRNKKYKERVNGESWKGDYRKFISNRKDASDVILENVCKALKLAGQDDSDLMDLTAASPEIDWLTVLDKQFEFLQEKYLQILCTCATYIYDYNPSLLAD
jgi:hypothetical protein